MNKNIPTAIFVDGDWLYAATRRINRKINYANFFALLINNFGTNTKIYFYGTINSADKKQVGFYALLKKIGYTVYCKELIKKGDSFISKGLDVQLSVDAMQKLPSFKKFVLISGDDDFTPLLKKIINNNIGVLVISLPFTTGYLLRKIVGSAFLNLETLISEHKDIKKIPTFKKGGKEKVLAPTNLYIQKGNYFEPYILIRNLMKSAKNNITIIDKYIDDQILTMVKLLKPEINITIITYKTSPTDFFVQVKKLKAEGRLITIYKTNTFHDRFIGIDNKWWHSGHSFKDLGSGDSILHKMNEKNSLIKLNNRVTKVINDSKKT